MSMNKPPDPPGLRTFEEQVAELAGKLLAEFDAGKTGGAVIFVNRDEYGQPRLGFKRSNFVALPIPTMSSPVAIGSSVPACPTLPPTRLRTFATTSCEVSPAACRPEGNRSATVVSRQLGKDLVHGGPWFEVGREPGGVVVTSPTERSGYGSNIDGAARSQRSLGQAVCLRLEETGDLAAARKPHEVDQSVHLVPADTRRRDVLMRDYGPHELLFLDEPSAGLDPISAVELDDLIKSLCRNLGITVVIVTHELPSIFRMVENCIVLDKAAKGIVARGDPRELRDTSDIAFVHNFFPGF